MYRGQEPAFCRGCGAPWCPGAARCERCDEPVVAAVAPDELGRALPESIDQRRWVGVLVAVAAAHGLALGLAFAQTWAEHRAVARILRGGAVSLDDLERLDEASFAQVAAVGTFVVLAAVFGRWLIRAGRNLRARGILDTHETDETRLLWFFVPVMHLHRPLLGMRELWRGSVADDPAEWRAQPVPWWLSAWWGLWIVSLSLGQLAMVEAFRAPVGPQSLRISEMELISLSLRLACLPLLVLVVVGIERAQRARAPRRRS